MQFKVLQINLQNSRAASLHVHQYLAEHKIQVALLQDAYVHPGANKPIGTPISWRTFAAKSNKAHILVNLDIAAMLTHRGFWSVSIKIETQGESIEFTNVYAPPRADFSDILQELDQVFRIHETRVVAGDFNAHSRQWGYSDGNQRGSQLTDLMAVNNMVLQNIKGSPPSFCTNRCKGWPDLTFSSPDLCNQFSGWRVITEEDSLSDHRFIEFHIKRVNEEAGRHRLLTSKGRHQKFKNGINRIAKIYIPRIESITTRPTLETATSDLLNDLRVLARSCYKEANVKKRGAASWWTPKLQIERQKLRALRRRFQREQEETQKVIYKAALNKGQARYKRLIIRARETKWRQFCTDAKEAYGPQYKILSKKLTEPSSLTALLNRDSNSQEEHMQSCLDDLFMTSHDPSTADDPEQDDTDQAPCQSSLDSVSNEEINRILSRLKSNKAAGHDCIDYVLLKRINKQRPKLLSVLLNKCLHLSSFPRAFKSGIVVLFLKPGKPPDVAKSYRPVCLLPSIGKLLERVIQGRIQFELLRDNFWSKGQFGFKWGLSTESALACIINKLENIRNGGEYGALVSFDFKGAFDQLSWQIVMEEIHKTNLSQYLKDILGHYLSGRTVHFIQNDIQVSRALKAGCPQGSCLGPLLWNVVADSAFKLAWADNIHIQAYADDFALAISGPTQTSIRTSLKEAIMQFYGWANSKSLEINIEKSKIMGTHALRGVDERWLRPIKLGSGKIETTKKIKYLGVTFTDKLKWDEHCLVQIQKAKEKFNGMYRYIGKNWGVPPPFIKIWYITVAERILLYAASAWANRLDKRSIERLTSCQRVFLLAATRANRTAPTSALQVLSGLLPIELSLKKEEAKGRILRLNTNYELYGKNWNLNDYESKINFWTKNPSMSVVIPPAKNTEKLVFYTDGSKTDDGVGAAAVLYVKEDRKYIEKERSMVKLRPGNSVFQAELQAIDMALTRGFATGKDFAVLTDSMSSLLALRRLDNTNPQIDKIHRRISKENPKFGISWVKAHTGNVGNERADTLAKMAVSQGDELTLELPRSLIAREIQQLVLTEWQNRWDMERTGRVTYKFFPKVHQNRHVYDRSLVQIYTGHGTVPEYLHRFRKIDSPDCTCGGPGSWFHYIEDCVLTANLHIKPSAQEDHDSWCKNLHKNKYQRQKLINIAQWVMKNEQHVQSAT